MQDGSYRVIQINGVKYIERLELKSGYVVAIRPIAKEDIKENGQMFGVWKDQESGIVYVDEIEVIDNIDMALAIARGRNELAIWDNENSKEIRV